MLTSETEKKRGKGALHSKYDKAFIPLLLQYLSAMIKMAGLSITLSLREDEVEKIKSFIDTNPAFRTRHEVVKFAIRKFLFPDETAVPLNGRS